MFTVCTTAVLVGGAGGDAGAFDFDCGVPLASLPKLGELVGLSVFFFGGCDVGTSLSDGGVVMHAGAIATAGIRISRVERNIGFSSRVRPKTKPGRSRC